jgi:hypothetical protein
LNHPQEDQEDGCQDSGLLVSRQNTDQHGSRSHNYQGPEKDNLTAEPVAEVAGKVAPEGAHEKSDSERGKGC